MSTRWQPPEWAKLPTASRQPQLDIFQDGVKTRTIELSGRRSLVLGRQAELVDLLVADETVSRQHVAVVNSSSATFIIDLKSAQGTFVAGDDVSPKAALGTQVKPAEAVQLEESQTVRLGGCKSVLRFSGLVEAEEVKWQIPAWCTLPHFVTELEGGPPDANISLDVSHTKGIVIGRSEERSDLAVADGSVSRQHAALVHDEEISYMVDLGSAHGTYVNASRIEEGVYTKLANGDRVSFGTCSFDFTVRITAQRLRGDDPKAKKKQKA